MKEERGKEKKIEKKERKESRVYCRTEGITVGKWRKDQEFQIYIHTCLHKYTSAGLSKKGRRLPWQDGSRADGLNGVLWGRLAWGLWKPLSKKEPPWTGSSWDFNQGEGENPPGIVPRDSAALEAAEPERGGNPGTPVRADVHKMGQRTFWTQVQLQGCCRLRGGDDGVLDRTHSKHPEVWVCLLGTWESLL